MFSRYSKVDVCLHSLAFDSFLILSTFDPTFVPGLTRLLLLALLCLLNALRSIILFLFFVSVNIFLSIFFNVVFIFLQESEMLHGV